MVCLHGMEDLDEPDLCPLGSNRHLKLLDCRGRETAIDEVLPHLLANYLELVRQGRAESFGVGSSQVEPCPATGDVVELSEQLTDH